jgi:hypothetical protein
MISDCCDFATPIFPSIGQLEGAAASGHDATKLLPTDAITGGRTTMKPRPFWPAILKNDRLDWGD